MRRLWIPVLCLALPAAAEEEQKGRDLMAEALRLFMKGLMSEMEPALDDLGQLLDNIDAYHPPEVLPNGDILIRRRHPLGPAPEEGGEIDL